MRSITLALLILAAAVLQAAAADEQLPALKVGKEVYTNVTVIKVTEVDISFMHARGMDNAKLKDLEPAWQKHFNYDPVKAAAVQQQQNQANAQYRQVAINSKPVRPPDTEVVPESQKAASDGSDIFIPVKNVSARRFLGGPPPPLVIGQWLTPAPDMNGKLLLIDFWATWCGP